MVCLLSPDGFTDPAIDAHLLPIMAWARAVWLGRIPLSDLQLVIDRASEKLGESVHPWRQVTGPGQAYLLTLLRLGCFPCRW